MALKDGVVKEIGTHDQLMKEKGLYFSLVTAQMTEEGDEEKEKDDVIEDLDIGEKKQNVAFAKFQVKK